MTIDRNVWLSCVGKGWHSLVECFLVEMEFVRGTPIQVKEKFGTLRLYWNPCDCMRAAEYLKAENFVETLEVLSGSVCESCGSTDSTVTTKGAWIKTLCSKCREAK